MLIARENVLGFDQKGLKSKRKMKVNLILLDENLIIFLVKNKILIKFVKVTIIINLFNFRWPLTKSRKEKMKLYPGGWGSLGF